MVGTQVPLQWVPLPGHYKRVRLRHVSARGRMSVRKCLTSAFLPLRRRLFNGIRRGKLRAFAVSLRRVSPASCAVYGPERNGRFVALFRGQIFGTHATDIQVRWVIAGVPKIPTRNYCAQKRTEWLLKYISDVIEVFVRTLKITARGDCVWKNRGLEFAVWVWIW